MTARLFLRTAAAADAPVIAALHARSWRSAYRGIFADAYLDGPIEAERLALWRGRMAAPKRGQEVVLAEAGGEAVGFACCFADSDPRWGSLVDNLHAAPDRRGMGIGHALMREIARHLDEVAPARPVHLLCLEGNAPAMRFYGRIGGTIAEREEKREPDGTLCAALRFTWRSPAALASLVR